MILTDAIFGQRNAVNLKPNTFIGGIASTIPDKATLASLLSISANNIPIFQIVGDNIEARVNQDYNTDSNFLWRAYDLTWWRDLDSHWKSTGGITFSKCMNLTEIIANGLITTGSQFCRDSSILKNVELNSLTILSSYCLQNAPIEFLKLPSATKIEAIGIGRNIKKIFAPNCKFLGDDLTNNNVFNFAKSGLEIYFHKDLDPSDADITDAQSKGVTVIRILNTTAPNLITNLSIGTKYATALQLNFTPPSSLNDIYFYECYVNGVKKNNISASVGYVTGLNPDTTYTITVKAVDIFYNKSDFSNAVSVTTSTTEPYPFGNIISYYRFNNNLVDEKNFYNGVGTAISYTAGKSGNAASFNGSTSIIKIQNTAFDIFGTANLSMGCFIKLNALPTSSYINIMAIEESNSHTTVDKALSVNANGSAAFYGYDGAPKKATSAAGKIPINTWVHLCGTFDGVTLRLYLNGILEAAQACSGTFNFTNPVLVFSQLALTALRVNGLIDGASIWNKELTSVEISEIYNKQNTGLELI